MWLDQAGRQNDTLTRALVCCEELAVTKNVQISQSIPLDWNIKRC